MQIKKLKSSNLPIFQSSNRTAVVLSSGGIDSTVAMAVAKKKGFEIYALSVDYGQRHKFELRAAAKVAKALGARRHLIVKVNLRGIGGSALTDKIRVPKKRSMKEIGSGIPVTYVPARNTVLLSLAMGWAEVLGANHIFFGANILDYSGYPDCRPEYTRAFEKMAQLATKRAVEGSRLKIHTPLIRLSKAQIIKLGKKLCVDFSLTHSCYDPDLRGCACGSCDACVLRRKGFYESGISDPTRYQKS